MDNHKKSSPSIAHGIGVIKGYLKTLPDNPGVYRMICDDEVLYVGKAKALKNRVSSYTYFEKLPHRLQLMVSLVERMEFIHTHTEAEALLLESNLIKKFQPRFNILLRDDKSFPYIVVRTDHDFPQILKHRGARKIKGHYFGPFASAGDVGRTIAALQRAFLLRNCTDSIFASRTRPCLQYHIKRCTAPCMGKVSKKEYARQVVGAYDFMQDKSRAVQDDLTKSMQEASEKLDYEGAASYRDRIRALTYIQARQDINGDIGDVDVIAISQDQGKSCVQVFFFRGGRNLGNRSYFPRHDAMQGAGAVLSAFIAQFYQNKDIPKEIIINYKLDDVQLLSEALSSIAQHRVKICIPMRGKKRRALDFVVINAEQSIKRNLASSAAQVAINQGVADLFDLGQPPKRIEIYDNSHISGTNMVGAMVVAGVDGFQKNAYRKFNIKSSARGDDYAMMREVLTRRFKRELDGDNTGVGTSSWPDLVLIDGGLGQLNACKDVLEGFGILNNLCLVAIAKGPDRNAGREKFFMVGREVFQLPLHDPVLHYLQRLRDEAHRFAIGVHRAKRTKQMISSPLDEIAGIGAKRKKALLLHFGSARAVSVAGVEDITSVSGVSQKLAQEIYDFFHIIK